MSRMDDSQVVGIEGIDLNKPSVPVMRSTLNIRIEVCKKTMNKELLVKKYGEAGYDIIVASQEPMMLMGYPRGETVVFVLV